MSKDGDVKSAMGQQRFDDRMVKLRLKDGLSTPRVVFTEVRNEDLDGMQIERRRRGWRGKEVAANMIRSVINGRNTST